MNRIEKQEFINKLKLDFNEFKKIPFPIVEDEDLYEIDTFLAGCIDSFIYDNGKYNKKNKDIITNCLISLKDNLNNLKDEKHFIYLKEISEKVLEFYKM